VNNPINDGGSISPRLVSTESGVEPQGGMSLRDWFAGMALQGYLAGRNNNPERETLIDRAVKSCYQYADAMLAARTKGGQDE
jgi:hypothetical protein